MSYDSDYWYVRDAGNVTGPFTRAEVMERWGRGELEWSHEVSQDRLIWVSVSTLGNPGSDGFEPGPVKNLTNHPKHPWRWIGTSVMGFGVLVGLGLLLQGIMTDETVAAAISRVLKEDDRISKETVNSLGANQTPSVYAIAIGKYLVQVQDVDMSDCPTDFRIAFERPLDCWNDLRTALKAMPEDFLQGFFVGFMNGYFFGEKDGGLTRMSANIQQASRNIKTSFREVEQLASNYGATLP